MPDPSLLEQYDAAVEAGDPGEIARLSELIDQAVSGASTPGDRRAAIRAKATKDTGALRRTGRS